MNSPELTLIVPSYNEEGAVSELLDKWVGVLESLKADYAIKVYDASRDGTPDILRRRAADNPRIIPVFCEKIGHGPTLVKAYRENKDRPWLFQIDSDDEMDHSSFHLLWEARDGFDILLGARVHRKSDLVRRFVSLLSRVTVHLFYGKAIDDVNAPYRLLRGQALGRLFEILPDEANAPNVIMSGWAARKKLRVFQTPVIHTERRSGAMISKWDILKISFMTFRQVVMFAFKHRA